MDQQAPEVVRPVDKSDWATRPFAATFDLISNSYGWTDDQILDLTLMRMRQIREVILNRERDEYRRQVRLEEAKVRTLVAGQQAAAGNKKGVRAAGRIKFLEDDEQEREQNIPYVGKVLAGFGPEGGGPDKILPAYTEAEIAAEIERLRASGELDRLAAEL